MDAKIAMAQEQRAMLRETIMMGLVRLVVERGKVKAAVLFDIKAGERIDKADKAAMKEAHSSGTSMKAGVG
jgi:pimeloyl-CoA synthetase